MESLTERLALLMKQVFDDQINQLIIKNRLENELVREREQKVNVLQSMMYAKNKTTLDANKSENEIGNTVMLKKLDSKLNDRDKHRATISLKNIWCGSSSIQANSEKYEELNAKQPEKEDTSKRSFVKVAKLAVLISQIKKDHDICTCESLDTICKLHDT